MTKEYELVGHACVAVGIAGLAAIALHGGVSHWNGTWSRTIRTRNVAFAALATGIAITGIYSYSQARNDRENWEEAKPPMRWLLSAAHRCLELAQYLGLSDS